MQRTQCLPEHAQASEPLSLWQARCQLHRSRFPGNSGNFDWIDGGEPHFVTGSRASVTKIDKVVETQALRMHVISQVARSRDGQ